VKHDLLSHQAVQEIKVLIPSERIEKRFKYTYTTTVNEVCFHLFFTLSLSLVFEIRMTDDDWNGQQAINSIVSEFCSGAHEASLMKDLHRWRMFLLVKKHSDGKSEGIWLDGKMFISHFSFLRDTISHFLSNIRITNVYILRVVQYTKFRTR
jgi:hypothetical protein